MAVLRAGSFGLGARSSPDISWVLSTWSSFFGSSFFEDDFLLLLDLFDRDDGLFDLLDLLDLPSFDDLCDDSTDFSFFGLVLLRSSLRARRVSSTLLLLGYGHSTCGCSSLLGGRNCLVVVVDAVQAGGGRGRGYLHLFPWRIP
ncbi:hypothetical protein PMAYCL1PPCAC_11971 [Pristionchus mayeri]|uniref:Uncharacterized protein n=1 Tax=Pristionchus mayeri TaxID=1317129 RepID=A0AAN4ZJ51_9BILA|nr:hypothetical protein PMAYCL1PPCAC_11971 [Pristionchus mayeri]